MSGRTVVVYKSIWSSEGFHQLSQDGDHTSMSLAFWLISSPESNHIGLFELNREQAIKDLGLDSAELDRALSQLWSSGFLHYKADQPGATWVFVINMARYQLGLVEEGQMVRAGDRRIRRISSLVEACPVEKLRHLFLARYGRALRLEEVN